MRRKVARVQFCKRPDRDAPKLVCGYPLPCPQHTLVINEDQLPALLDLVRRKVRAR